MKTVRLLFCVFFLMECMAATSMADDKKPEVNPRVQVLKNTIIYASEKMEIHAAQYKSYQLMKAQAERELKILEKKDAKAPGK
jgi:hypothetical protein